MPEPGGPTLAEAEAVLRNLARARPVAGLGLTGLTASADPAPSVGLVAAAGL